MSGGLKYEREVLIQPAYDKRGETPNYGRHNAEIMFCLRDEERKAAVILTMYTGWEVPSSRADGIGHAWEPSGTVEWHTTFGAPPDNGKCYWLGDKPCTVPRNEALSSHALIELLVAEGSDALWKRLEELYVEEYGKPRRFHKMGH